MFLTELIDLNMHKPVRREQTSGWFEDQPLLVRELLDKKRTIFYNVNIDSYECEFTFI